MDEELKELIKRLVSKGATDEEIDIVVQNYRSKPKEQPIPEMEAPQADPTVGETITHSLGQFNKVATDAVPDLLQTAGVATNWAGNKLKDATNAVGLTDYADAPVESNPLYAMGKGLATAKENIEYSDPRLQDNFWATDLPAGFGSVAAVMMSQGRSLFKALPMKAAGQTFGTKEAAKMTAKELAQPGVVTGGAMMGVPEYDAAIEAGLSEDEAFEVLLKNYMIGGTEVLPIERTIKFINSATGGAIVRALKGAAKGQLEEAIQEGAQTYLSNMVAQGSYDPDRDEMDGVIRAMAAGALIGGGLGGVGGAVSSRERAPEEEPIVKDVEIQSQLDPDLATGDPELDEVIDLDYRKIAGQLDAIELTEEDVIPEYQAEPFSEVNEENEILSQDLTPKEAGAVQASAPLDAPLGETLLDNAEATPALDTRIQEFTPSINDENEIPPSVQLTPSDATAVQAARLPSQPVQEVNLDDSESTPTIDDRQQPQAVVPEPTPSPTTPAAPAKVTPKKPEVDHFAEAEKKAKEKHDKLLDKTTKMLENIKKDKPGKRLKRLQQLDEQTLEHEDINKLVVKDLEHERAIQDDKLFEKLMKTATTNEKLDMLVGRADSDEDTKTVEEIKAAEATLATNDLDAIERAKADFDNAVDKLTNSINLLGPEKAQAIRLTNEIKAKFDKALEPRVRAEKEAKGKTEERSKAITKAKDKFLRKVAKATLKDNPVSIDEAVKEYQAWRKKEGLTPITDAKVKEHANAPLYKQLAESDIKRDELDERKRQRAEEEAAKDAAKKEAQKDIRKEMGFSEDTDISEIGFSGEIEPHMQKHAERNFGVLTKVSPEQLFKRIEASYIGDKQFVASLKKLFELSMRVSRKQSTTGLEIYLANNATGSQGFYAADETNNRQVLVVNSQSKGDVDAHELVHFIVSSITHNFAKFRGKSAIIDEFYAEAKVIFSDARAAYRDKLLRIYRDVKNGEQLSTVDRQFVALLQAYLRTNKVDEYTRGPLTAEQIKTIYDNTFRQAGGYTKGRMSYLFYDVDELLAESFSNPYAMGLLSMLEDPKAHKGKQVSLFRSLIDSLKKMLTKIANRVGIKFTPVNNNYLESVTNFMEEMESKYLTEESIDAEVQPPSFVDGLKRGVSNLFREFHAMAPLTGRKFPQKLMPIVNTVANKAWRQVGVRNLQDVQDIVDKINAQSTKNKLPKEAADIIWAKIEKYRGEWADAKQIQINVRDFGRELPEYKDDINFREDLEDFAIIDLDNLPISKIRDVENGMLQLISHGIPSQSAYNAANRARAEAKLKALLPFADQFAKNLDHVKHVSNVATFTTVAAKYNTPAASKAFEVLFGNLLSVRKNTDGGTLETSDQMYNVAEQFNLDQRDYNKVAAFGTVFSTIRHPNHPQYWEEIAFNLDVLVANAENKLEALKNDIDVGSTPETVQSELDTAKRLKSEILSKRSMRGILNPGQWKLYNITRAFFEKHQAAIQRNAVGVHGDNTFYPYYNYFPTQALGRVKTGRFGSTDNDLVPNPHTQNLWESLQTEKNFGHLASRQAGNTRERTMPKGHYYDYNAFSIMNKVMPTVLYDMYGTREIKALNLLVNGVQGKPVTVDGKNIYNVMSSRMVEALNFQLKHTVGLSRPADKEMWRLVKWFTKLGDHLKTAMIATGGQWIVQMSSAVPASLIMSPKGFYKAMKVITGIEKGTVNPTTFNEFIKREGLTIQFRDALFDRFLTEEDVQKSGLPREMSHFGNAMEKTATALVRAGDKTAARLVWLSAFFAAGGTLDNPTRAAVLEAERMVGVLQNMNHISFGSPLLKNNKTVTSKILLQMLMSFKTFGLNNAVNIYKSVPHLGHSGEARRIFFANLMMSLSYQYATIYIVRQLYGTVAAALLDFDDDDDDQEKVSPHQYVAENVFWDMTIGQASPPVFDALARFTVGEVRKDLARQRGEKFDPRKDSGLYTPRDFSDATSEAFGPYGDLAEIIKNMSLNMYKLTSMGLDVAEYEENEMDLMLWQLLRDIAMTTRIFPIRGDIQKLLRLKIRQVQGESTSGRATPQGFSGTDSFEDSGTMFEGGMEETTETYNYE